MLQNQHKKGGINLWPLVIIGILVYLFINYDVETIIKNKQLNKNIDYIKSFILENFGKLSSNVKNNFLKGDFSSLNTPDSSKDSSGQNNTNPSTGNNKLIDLSLENFLPEGIKINKNLNQTNTTNKYDQLLDNTNKDNQGGLR